MHRLPSLPASRGIALRLALFYGASFAVIGIYLPYWPVWLAAEGLSATQIGVLLAASFWPRVLTSVLVPYAADRRGDHRRLMIGLAALTLVATALFALAGPFWLLLLLSMVVGAGRAALLPVGEAMALQSSATARAWWRPTRGSN